MAFFWSWKLAGSSYITSLMIGTSLSRSNWVGNRSSGASNRSPELWAVFMTCPDASPSTHSRAPDAGWWGQEREGLDLWGLVTSGFSPFAMAVRLSPSSASASWVCWRFSVRWMSSTIPLKSFRSLGCTPRQLLAVGRRAIRVEGWTGEVQGRREEDPPDPLRRQASSKT